MRRATSPDPKHGTLRRQRCANPHPDAVLDPLFLSSDFFDPRDLVQVKYEMLRRVRVDRETISKSAKAFGFSRPSFYQARAAFERGGLAALIPKKRGPHRAHKLDDDVVQHLREKLSQAPHLRAVELKACVLERFGISVHARSIERALARHEKKRKNRRHRPAGNRAAVTSTSLRTRSSANRR